MADAPGCARTITETLDHVLEVEPQRVAAVGPSGSLTYAQLDARADAAAALLRDLGVGPGEPVAAALPNDLDIVVAFHGAMRLGAIWVGVSKVLAPPEKEALLAASGAAVLLADADTATELELPTARTVAVGGATDAWRAGLHAFAGAARPAPPDPDRPAALAYTSGTTGLPTGIVHSQRNLLLPAAALAASRRYDETLRKGDCLPLTILNLMILTTLLTSAAGGCCVLTDRRDARGVAEWLGRESVTVWNGVPAQLHSMVHDPDIDPAQLAALTEVWVGGAGCPEELFDAFRARFGRPVRATYGLTEAPSVVTIDPVDGDHVAGASGIALPHLRLCVVDDDGAVLPVGSQGEITVSATTEGPWRSAYTPMLGRWGGQGLEPVAGRELRTGDLGRLDDDGRLFVTERKKLTIIRGGANVYPAEVERVLAQAPGVGAAVVIGLPDPRLGHRVMAVVEALPDGTAAEDALREFCLARLARYKVPERIVVVDRLARNAMGKVRRAGLPELFA